MCELHPRVISDHSPIILHFTSKGTRPSCSTWTFERKLLLDNEYCSHMSDWIKNFFLNNKGSASWVMIWDAFKAAVRGETLSFSIHRQKVIKKKIHDWNNQLREAEEALIKVLPDQTRRDSCLRQIAICRSRISQHFGEEVAASFIQYRTDIYELGENTGRLLGKRLQHKRLSNQIRKIKDNTGQLQDQPD